METAKVETNLEKEESMNYFVTMKLLSKNRECNFSLMVKWKVADHFEEMQGDTLSALMSCGQCAGRK